MVKSKRYHGVYAVTEKTDTRYGIDYVHPQNNLVFVGEYQNRFGTNAYLTWYSE